MERIYRNKLIHNLKLLRTKGSVIMNQVYCTDCINFKIVKIGKDDFIPQCKHNLECCLDDCEDSKNIEERPFYKEA